MPIKKRIETRDPIDYYGVVEEIVESDPQNSRSRSFLLIDCVRADLFERQGAEAIYDRSALALVRAMSTPKRWEEQFGLGEIATGDWLSFRLDDSGDVPRAWELRADYDYASGPSRSIKSMRRISGPGASLQANDKALVMRLLGATAATAQRRPRIGALEAVQRFGSGGQIEIVVLDVGQASAGLIKRDGRPIGYFDIGAPIWFNKGSLPKPMLVPSISDGFVVVSHWDFDHFDLGRRHKPYHALDWYAPDQPVGPNTARFQADLGAKLTFIDGTATHGGFTLARGTSTVTTDRNGSGYQLRYEENGKAVILTGDTAYDLIQPSMISGVGAVTVPHHGGRSSATAPHGATAPARAILSYGDPNSYRHPHPQTLTDHQRQGWKLTSTARTTRHKRGDRVLFP